MGSIASVRTVSVLGGPVGIRIAVRAAEGIWIAIMHRSLGATFSKGVVLAGIGIPLHWVRVVGDGRIILLAELVRLIALGSSPSLHHWVGVARVVSIATACHATRTPSL